MKRVLVGVLLLALAGGATWWFTRGGGSGPAVGDGPAADGTGAEPPETAEAARLAGKGAVAPSKPVRTGRSSIVGTVRRGALPVAAKVEVRRVQDAPPSNPYAQSRTRFFGPVLQRANATGDVAGRARAGDDGRFAVEGLPTGVYDVSAVADDGARGATGVTIQLEGTRVEANPIVSGGNETLHGRVVHADGRVWQGQVALEAGLAGEGFDGSGARGVDVALDGDGRFTVGGLAAGPVQLMAIAPDAFRATSRPIVVPYAGEFLFVVDAGLLSLRGRVVADVDGSPVPGAVVTAVGGGSERTVVASRARSDAEGRFEVLVSPSEGWSAQVTADGFAPSFRQGAEVSSEEPIEVRLVKGATLRGRVTREGDGGPAAGLTVMVVPIGDARGYAAGGGSGTTDADGRYEITGLSSREAGAVAEGPGWITKGIRQFDERGYNPLALALTPGATTVFDLVVVPGARAEGVVLDTGGAPVAGAVVTAQPSGGMRSFQVFGFGTSTTASRADGTFVLDALMPNLAYGFIAQAPGYARASAGPLVTTEAGVVTVEIRFPAPRFLDVTVLDDASGAPIAGARVSGGAPSASATGADGVARVGPVPPHGVRLWVDSDGYIASARGGDISVADGDTSRVVRLFKALEIAGRVVAADHSPAPGATVELQSLGQDRGGRGPSTVTAVDGTFRFRGLPSLGYTVRARLRADGTSLTGSATASAGATDLVITLGTGPGEDTQTTLLVRAVDPSGKPVLRATVRWVSPTAGSRGTSMTDGVARVQIGANRTAGTVEVSSARGVDGSLLPLGPATVPVAADAFEVEVPLPPEVRIEGVVLGPGGTPVPGVVVTAVPKERAGEYAWSRSSGVSRSRTDGTGAFHLGGLGPQEYLLQVQPPPEFVTPEPIPATGDAKSVEIRLEAGLVATVTVLDADGKPVVGATVRADADERNLPEVMTGRSFPRTDSKGVALVLGLTPGKAYRLQVTSERTDVLAETRARWQPHDETIRMGRAFTVKGLVRDTRGRPVAGADVSQKLGDDDWNATTTAADGTFTITQVPAGNVVLRPGLDGLEGNAPEVTVAAGASDVVLTLDVGAELTVRIDNWPSARARGISLSLRTQRGERQGSRSAEVGRDGVITFRGLHPDDVCALFVPPVGDGLSVLLRGLKPGSDVRAHLEPGKTITARLRLPAGATRVRVVASLDDVASLSATPEADGRFTVRGAIDGTWKIGASATSADLKTRYDATGEVPAGASIDLELKPRP